MQGCIRVGDCLGLIPVRAGTLSQTANARGNTPPARTYLIRMKSTSLPRQGQTPPPHKPNLERPD